jgi:hypothetical protein
LYYQHAAVQKDKPATESTQENANTTTTELPSTSESTTPKSNSVVIVEGKILILMAVFLLIKTRKNYRPALLIVV